MSQPAPFFDQALSAWNALRATPATATVDAEDRVAATYFNQLFLAGVSEAANVQTVQIDPAIPCPENALRLAFALENRPFRLANVPHTLTAEQLARRLQRVGSTFPVGVLLDMSAGIAPRILTVHGVRRPDGWNILMLPADPTRGLPAAHFTFCRLGGDPRHRHLADQAPGIIPAGTVVVWRSPHVPLCLNGCRIYWHWKRDPATVVEFNEWDGDKCDCDFDRLCCHERIVLGKMTFSRSETGGRLLTFGAPIIDGTEHLVLDKFPGAIVTSKGWKVRTMNGSWLYLDHTREVGLRIYEGREIVPTLERWDLGTFSGWIAWSTIPKFWSWQRLKNFLVPEWLRQPEMWNGQFKAGQPDPRDPIPGLSVPELERIVVKAATREGVEATWVRDTLRRHCNEYRWHPGSVVMDRDTVDYWVSLLVTERAGMLQPNFQNYLDPRVCISCLRVTKIHHRICKPCRRAMRRRYSFILEPCSYFFHVGPVPIFSAPFVVPEFTLAASTRLVVSRTRRIRNRSDLLEWLSTQSIDYSARGALYGPMFCCWRPSCFAKGRTTTAVAFCLRLGVAKPHPFHRVAYDLLFDFVVTEIFTEPIEKTPRHIWLEHFTIPEKLEKMLKARQEKRDGELPIPARASKFKAFAKSEKNFSFIASDDVLVVDKGPLKPRLICSPSPAALNELGPYTFAQTKSLAHICNYRERMFYAGCANPVQMNHWLEIVVTTIVEVTFDFFVVEDDISAMDASHSQGSMDFQRRLRHRQYPLLPPEIEELYERLRNVDAYAAEMWMHAEEVNASGISATSYNNSVLAMPIRVISIAYALNGGRLPSVPEVQHVLLLLRTAASGDDGLTFIRGPPPTDFHRLYSECWSLYGFDVKVNVRPASQWRLSTFLGMRPVWTKWGYRWAVEPGRRLKTLFWAFETTCHPIAWARGVALQNNQLGGCLPVFGEIVRHVLSFSGPTKVFSDQPGWVWNGYDVSEGQTDRTVAEFLSDYDIPFTAYVDFVSRLEQCHDLFYHCVHPVVHAVLDKA